MNQENPLPTLFSLASLALPWANVPLTAYDGDSYRSLTSDRPLVVEIRVAPEPPTEFFIYEEEIPEDYFPVRISHCGTYDELVGSIKWGPLPGDGEVVLSYALLGPEGIRPVSGNGVFGFYPIATKRSTKGASTIEMPSPFSSYESWSYAWFGSAGFRAPEAAHGYRSGTSVPNGVAFAAASPPGVHPSDLISVTWKEGNPPVVTVEVERNVATEESVLRVWRSFDLLQWSELDTESPEVQRLPLSNDRERLLLPVVPEGRSVFVRLSAGEETAP